MIAAEYLRCGEVVAIKGLGGFQILVDARNQEAVKLLRRRKYRLAKPFAIMCPTMEAARQYGELFEPERELLTSQASPIVLLKKSAASKAIAAEVSPDNPYLGVMIPYTPLHHILMQELSFPVVATSGNISGETLCIDEKEAVKRLQNIASIFLVHDRRIVCPVDDSVVKVVAGEAMTIRRARGYAPTFIDLGDQCLPNTLAFGAHLKSSIALSNQKSEVVVSQHIGDLESPITIRSYDQVLGYYRNLYREDLNQLACDLHPGYISTHVAESFRDQTETKLSHVQHHHAHVLACMAENKVVPPALGIAWDGTGFGLDHTIWGGEFFLVDQINIERLAHFRTFSLPGGEQAVREGKRVALGLLYEIEGESSFSLPWVGKTFAKEELKIFRQMLQRGINSPRTSSVGRLFDGVAALIDLKDRSEFEGEAAMGLEFVAAKAEEGIYLFEIKKQDEIGPVIIDWEQIIKGVLADLVINVDKSIISAKFHNTLVEIIRSIVDLSGRTQVLLSGGCFQNSYLLEHTVNSLGKDGYVVYWHKLFPPNDGSISLGQIVSIAREQRRVAKCV